MHRSAIGFTAVFMKSAQGYVGFVEELPGVTTHGRTLDEARENLRAQAELVFREERTLAEEMLRGKDVVRERFVVGPGRVA